MSGVHIFITVWCILALGLGTLFTVRPDLVNRMYLRQYGHPPTAFQQALNRFGGVFFIILALVIGSLTIAGRFPPDPML